MQHSTRWAAALCASASFAAAAAGAQEVHFSGFTNGCFGFACAPGTTNAFASIPVGAGVLSYVNATFDETTAGGTLALGGTPRTVVQNFNNLGSFVINTAAAPVAPGEENLSGTPFTLAITFTDPLGITSPVNGQVFTYDATITGSVRRLTNAGPGAGGYTIDFLNNLDANPPILFTYAGGRSFTLEIADVNVNPTAGAASVTAFITAVPEPTSVALLGTGVLLVGASVRRRARG